MAVIDPTQNGSDVNALLRTAPDKYISLGDLLKYNKPDNRDLLIQTYGDQGITGFLQLTGATRSAGTSDEVQYWEEGRLHKTFEGALDASEGKIYLGNVEANAAARVNDVIMDSKGNRWVVASRTEGTANAPTATNEPTLNVVAMDGSSYTGTGSDVGTISGTGASGNVTFIIIGNIYAQGTGQPTEFYQTDVTKRINPFMITKETFHVNGSQATNIGWINVGNGDYRWYVKGEMDTRKRFMNQREMMMLFAQRVADTATANNDNITIGDSTKVTGSEGYFAAIEDRGITTTGTFGDGAGFADIDEIIFELDAQGAPSEYAMYVDNKTSLNIDDMLAQGLTNGAASGDKLTAGLAGQFGAFNNDPNMAVNLGFKSFSRGGYTFHKHDWKLLNDPTLLGAFANKPYKGAMVPMTQVADAKTGVKSPALEMNFKEANGYSREMEHWVEGGGVLGFKTNDQDVAKFHYRSECNLITRAANQHVALK
jgi:hypothetical protein